MTTAPPGERYEAPDALPVLLAPAAVLTTLALGASCVFFLRCAEGSHRHAVRTIDTLSLQFHYQALQLYKHKHGHYPKRSGHEFILAPWVEGIVARTAENRDRYFSAAEPDNPRSAVLKRLDPTKIWTSFAGLTPADTSFLGPSKLATGRLTMTGQVWLEVMHRDGTVLQLMSNGVVRVHEP